MLTADVTRSSATQKIRGGGANAERKDTTRNGSAFAPLVLFFRVSSSERKGLRVPQHFSSPTGRR